MTDLGTLGGIRSTAFASNTARQVVGGSTTAGSDRFLAVLWENDVITELGTFRGAESFADSINTSGQVVGYAVISDNISWHAFV